MSFVEYRGTFAFGLMAGVIVFLGWKLANDRVTWDYLYELRQGPAQPELREQLAPSYREAVELCRADPVSAYERMADLEREHGFVLMNYWLTRKIVRCMDKAERIIWAD